MTTEIVETPVPSPTPAPRPWKHIYALGLPEGSIRAALALIVVGTIWILLARRPHQEVPDYLRDLMFIILGHYFATRKRPSPDVAAGPGPLFLPRGAVRWIMFAGFGGVAFLLYRDGRFRAPLDNPGVVTLMLVAGFLLGVAMARIGDWWRKGRPAPRWFEDFRALVAIAAALTLILLVWVEFPPRNPELFDMINRRLGPNGVRRVLGAIVGFYFGSRS